MMRVRMWGREALALAISPPPAAPSAPAPEALDAAGPDCFHLRASRNRAFGAGSPQRPRTFGDPAGTVGEGMSELFSVAHQRGWEQARIGGSHASKGVMWNGT